MVLFQGRRSGKLKRPEMERRGGREVEESQGERAAERRRGQSKRGQAGTLVAEPGAVALGSLA